MQLALGDIGGTNARFALAQIDGSGAIKPSEPVVLKTSDFPDLASAWRAFADRQEGFAPEAASLAVAGPVGDGAFKLTNASWHLDPARMASDLGVERVHLLNDFAAIGYALGHAPQKLGLGHRAGPQIGLPNKGTITLLGPGTGLGVAHIHRSKSGVHIQPTEGAHIDFAPQNAVDDAVLADLREKYDRVSLERVISGDGIVPICRALARLEGSEPGLSEPLAIWEAGLAGSEPLALRAVEHFVATLGRVAGDYALAHGAKAVVIAGGIGLRLGAHLSEGDFHRAFTNKGRYRSMMETVPIKLITHPQPGLLGAAYGYYAAHPDEARAPR